MTNEGMACKKRTKNVRITKWKKSAIWNVEQREEKASKRWS